MKKYWIPEMHIIIQTIPFDLNSFFHAPNLCLRMLMRFIYWFERLFTAITCIIFEHWEIYICNWNTTYKILMKGNANFHIYVTLYIKYFKCILDFLYSISVIQSALLLNVHHWILLLNCNGKLQRNLPTVLCSPCMAIVCFLSI